MQRLIALALLACLSAPVSAWAAETERTSRLTRSTPAGHALTTEPPRLLAAALREGTRLAVRRETGTELPVATRATSTNWISRHPALFGTLIGAGAGAIASATMENELFCSGGDEDCFFHGGSRIFVGAGMGAGIGALIGWIGGR